MIKERLAITVKNIMKFIKEKKRICNIKPMSVAVMLAFQLETRTP